MIELQLLTAEVINTLIHSSCEYNVLSIESWNFVCFQIIKFRQKCYFLNSQIEVNIWKFVYFPIINSNWDINKINFMSLLNQTFHLKASHEALYFVTMFYANSV